jgi:hypothetical protein
MQEEKGYRHEEITHALATIERLGRESGQWDTISKRSNRKHKAFRREW